MGPNHHERYENDDDKVDAERNVYVDGFPKLHGHELYFRRRRCYISGEHSLDSAIDGKGVVDERLQCFCDPDRNIRGGDVSSVFASLDIFYVVEEGLAAPPRITSSLGYTDATVSEPLLDWSTALQTLS